MAHRVNAYRIRYVFLFSEETSELYRLLLELNDFSGFRPNLFPSLMATAAAAATIPEILQYGTARLQEWYDLVFQKAHTVVC